MAWRRLPAFLSGVLCASVLCGASASAEECKRVLEQAAGYLEQCDGQIRSFSLQMSDERWRPVNGPHGKMWFICRSRPPIESRPGMLEILKGVPDSPEAICPEEPLTSFAFVWLSHWDKSQKDEAAILETLSASTIASYEEAIPPSAISCRAVDVSIGTMRGRAVCLKVGDASIIAAVFSDRQTAFVLAFSQKGQTPEVLKEKVIGALLPRFAIERAAGDAGLLRWLQ